MTDAPKKSPDASAEPEELEDVAIEPVSRSEARRIHNDSPLSEELAQNLDKPGALIPGLTKLGTMAVRWVSQRIFQDAARKKAAEEQVAAPMQFDAFFSDAPKAPAGGGAADFDEAVAEIRRLLSDGKARAALPLAQDLALNHPFKPLPRILIARCFSDMGDAVRAVSLLESLSKEEGTPPETFLRLGEARHAAGDERQAKISFLRCAAQAGADDPIGRAARTALNLYGAEEVVCESCGTKIEPDNFRDVGGRLLCGQCENASRNELSERTREAEAGGKAALDEIKRKARRRLMVKVLVYLVLLLAAGVAVTYFAKLDAYKTFRDRLGPVGKILPAPLSGDVGPAPRSSRAPRKSANVKPKPSATKPSATTPNEAPATVDEGKDRETDNNTGNENETVAAPAPSAPSPSALSEPEPVAPVAASAPAARENERVGRSDRAAPNLLEPEATPVTPPVAPSPGTSIPRSDKTAPPPTPPGAGGGESFDGFVL